LPLPASATVTWRTNLTQAITEARKQNRHFPVVDSSNSSKDIAYRLHKRTQLGRNEFESQAEVASNIPVWDER